MAASEGFISYVLEQLEPFARVTSRRMFGGAGLYAHDAFFGLIADDTLMSYYEVPADVLDDAEELSRWARGALAVAIAATNAKGQSKTSRTVRRKKPTAKAK